MLKTLAKLILSRFDTALVDAKTLREAQDEKLEAFAVLTLDKVRKIVLELVQSDNRVTHKEERSGFTIFFKHYILFRVTVFRLTERIELSVDRVRILKFDGLNDEAWKLASTKSFDNLLSDNILSAFDKNMLEVQENEISRI